MAALAVRMKLARHADPKTKCGSMGQFGPPAAADRSSPASSFCGRTCSAVKHTSRRLPQFRSLGSRAFALNGRDGAKLWNLLIACPGLCASEAGRSFASLCTWFSFRVSWMFKDVRLYCRKLKATESTCVRNSPRSDKISQGHLLLLQLWCLRRSGLCSTRRADEVASSAAWDWPSGSFLRLGNDSDLIYSRPSNNQQMLDRNQKYC